MYRHIFVYQRPFGSNGRQLALADQPLAETALSRLSDWSARTFARVNTCFLACSVMLVFPLFPALAEDLPTGGTVTAGTADIGAPSAGALLIDQSSTNAIIDWGGFSIGSGHSVQFNNGSGATLNRVTGGNISAINGALGATGSVFVINQNGIIVGKDGVVSTGGSFVASTLDVDNADFMGGGDLTFSGTSNASAINLGKVSSLGGDVGFLAHTVINEGTLNALEGTVGLAAGREILLRDAALDDGKFAVRVGSAGSSVQEKGMVNAANVELRANGGNVYALAGNTDGMINATGVTKQGGRIFLTAGEGGTVVTTKKIVAKRTIVRNGTTQTDGGDVFINADIAMIGGLFDLDGAIGGGFTLNATSATLTGQISAIGLTGQGGTIDVGASDAITLAGATLDTSGFSGGGTIRVGGEFQGGKDIDTDEVQNVQTLLIDEASTLISNGTGTDVNGGTIIAWADGTTTFKGSISATGTQDGGFAEVSGKDTLSFGGVVDLSGNNGNDGTLLLDPTNFTIDAATATNIIAAFASADVVISTDAAGVDAGDIFIISDVLYDSINDLTLLAHRHIIATASVQNANDTGGDINLVAGWDGTTGLPATTGTVFSGYTFNAIPFDNVNVNDAASLYGNDDGSVFIGDGTQTAGVAVGSRSGTTRVYGYDLSILAGSGDIGRYAQLGFQVLGAGETYVVTGALSANVLNNIVATGSSSSSNSYAQLGHGGGGQSSNTNVDATISADIAIFAGNDLMFTGGTRQRAYAQLGHGGYVANGDFSGDITIGTANDLIFAGGGSLGTFSYAQLGHGGPLARGDRSGDITIVTANDLRFMGGDSQLTYAQLGHGGRSSGNNSGNITIGTVNDLSFKGGSASSTHAQLGHAGSGTSGNQSGDITIDSARNLSFEGGSGEFSSSSFAQLGHGGRAAFGNQSGDITISTAEDLILKGGSGQANYAQLGHGSANFGSTAQASGTLQGNITVMLMGEASFVSGASPGTNRNYGFFGHASSSTENAILNADVLLEAAAVDGATATVASGGDSTLRRDILENALSGGNVTIQVTDSNLVLPNGDDFSYDSGNDLSLISASNVLLLGTLQNENATGGDINLIAGWDGNTAFSSATFDDVDVNDAPSFYGNNDGTVFIGNGSQTSGIAVGSRSGTTRVYGYDLSILAGSGGSGRYAQLGFHVTNRGDIYAVTGALSAHVVNDIVATGGSSNSFNYALLGHGGADQNFNNTQYAAISAPITVSAGHDLNFTGGSGDNAAAQLGHGGSSIGGDHSGDIRIITANDLIFNAGSGSRASAQLGHGGYDAGGNHSGSIIIETVNDLIFTGADGNQAAAQLGHGGVFADGNHSGDIMIIDANDLTFVGGSVSTTYAQLGHGGGLSSGAHSGNITITNAQNLTFTGGSGTSAFAQLGHTATTASSDLSGDITIGNANDLNFSAGTGTNTYAQLGHGGVNVDGNHSGDIMIEEAHDLTFTGGTGSSAYARIGHGGIIVDGNLSGDILINNANDLTFTGGSSFGTYAQLGHGGGNSDGNYSGGITIGAANNLSVVGGSYSRAYAQLGHGSSDNGSSSQSVGLREGDISVTLTGEASFVDGTTFTDGFFGHASGDANAISNANVFLQAAAIDAASAVVASGGNSTLRGDILSNALSGGNVTIQLTDSSLVLPNSDDFTYDSVNDLLLTTSLDMMLNSALQNANSNGGNVTFRAGRSIFVDADIGTGNGDLTLQANTDVEGDRSTGVAEITVSDGVSIDAGTGAVLVDLADGTGNTNGDAGDVTFAGNNSVSAGSIQILNQGVQAGSQIILGAGTTLTASGSDTSMVLSSDIFTNNAGANVLSVAGDGRFLVYSLDWDNDTKGGVTGGNLYNRTFAGNPPASITQSGSQFIYARQPTLTITAADVARIYGDDNPTFTALFSGLVNGDTGSGAVSGEGDFTTIAVFNSDVGNYVITAAQGSLVSDQGYALTFTNAGVLTVTPRALTVTAFDAVQPSDGPPYFGGAGVYGTGFAQGDGLSDLGGIITYAGSSQGATADGNYTITPGGLTSTNYDVSFADGTLTIGVAQSDYRHEDNALAPLTGEICTGDLLNCPLVDVGQIMGSGN